MKSLAILAVGLFATLNANARLGWTLDQCRQKYGTEKKTTRNADLDTPVYIFETPYFKIIAGMMDGKVTPITYVAIPEWTPTGLFNFYTRDVIDVIVRKNVGDQKLIEESSGIAGLLSYKTKDGTSVNISPPNGQYNEEHVPMIDFESAERDKLKPTAQEKSALVAREIAKGL